MINLLYSINIQMKAGSRRANKISEPEITLLI